LANGQKYMEHFLSSSSVFVCYMYIIPYNPYILLFKTKKSADF